MAQASCFVIMPFRPELHYMYLFVAQHLEKEHNLRCERGDSQILTRPLLEKIQKFIQDADVIIADCSGRNPNVFYELGMAHVLGKPVVLVTSDDVAAAPTDVKAFEFIKYDLHDHEGYLRKLDMALRSALGRGYESLFDGVTLLMDEFCHATGKYPARSSKEEFVRAAGARARGATLPAVSDAGAIARYLPDLLGPPLDIDVVTAVRDWIKQKWPPPA